MAQTIKLAVIPGDGIGPEVIDQAVRVLDAVAPASGVTFDKTHFALGADRYLATGDVLSDADLAAIATHDAILLGAVGGKPNDPNIPAGIIERGLLLKLRFSLDQYVNLRPTKVYPQIETPLASPGTVDFVVVREGTEGPYAGNGGRFRTDTPHEVATEVSINTAFGVERVVRYAFELAAKRPRKKLTWVHKTNVLTSAGQLWTWVVGKVAAEFPQIELDYLHIDAATIFFVTDPARFDVIVTDNLFGDILTDLGGAVSGGIGIASSANLNPAGTGPSMFEPVHGSAPDIVGTGKANPVAAILSAAHMLEFLGENAMAERVRAACQAPASGSTSQMGDEISARVAN
jgi:3-isopropylmalate dehydrogenase